MDHQGQQNCCRLHISLQTLGRFLNGRTELWEGGRGHIWGGIDLKLVKTAIFNVERGGGTYLGGIFGNDGQPDSKSHHLKTH